MLPSETVYFVLLSITVLLSQLIPPSILLLCDNIFIRIIMVLFLLYLSNVGPTVAIFGLVAIAIIYLERNRYKVIETAKSIDIMDTTSRPATIKEASIPQTTISVTPFDKPDSKDTDFIPEDINNDGSEDNTAPYSESSINTKTVLSSIYPRTTGSSSVSELFEDLGFGHKPDVETLGND
jgi:hypothetical protein